MRNVLPHKDTCLLPTYIIKNCTKLCIKKSVWVIFVGYLFLNSTRMLHFDISDMKIRYRGVEEMASISELVCQFSLEGKSLYRRQAQVIYICQKNIPVLTGTPNRKSQHVKIPLDVPYTIENAIFLMIVNHIQVICAYVCTCVVNSKFTYSTHPVLFFVNAQTA